MDYKLLLKIVAMLTMIAFEGDIKRTTEACSSVDLEGLIGFKNEIQLDTSGRLAKWIGRNCCEWEGIICDNATTRVTHIHLPGFIDGDLFQTQMMGQISTSITLITSLEVLDLGGLVGLSGTIPQTLGMHLQNLQKCYLFGNNLTGPIPESIGELRNLRELELHENKLSGSIPSSLGSLKNLIRLLLYSNQISGCGIQGQIPNILERTISPIQELDLSVNLLIGTIPSWIGSLSQLYLLNLSKNSLDSHIPDSITNLHDLGVLDLHSNELTGNIPHGFLRLRNLKELNLSDNVLEGEIPEGKPLTDFPGSSYSGNKGLCGKPLSPCKL